MSVSFILKKECFDKTEDRGGLWETEGGAVMFNKVKIGRYSSVRRTSCGTAPLNSAMLWMTLFIQEPKRKTWGNITLHGAHGLKTGGERGSVSAATTEYVAHMGKQFKRVANTLTIE